MTPRWLQFVLQAVLLAIVGLIVNDLDHELGVAILVVAGCLFLAGLIGGAVDRGDDRKR